MVLSKTLKQTGIIFLLALMYFSYGCSNNKSNNKSGQKDSSKTIVSVNVDSVRRDTLDETVSAYGIISVNQIFQVISPITGKIIRFNLFNGDTAKKGELIAAIVTKEYYSALKGAQEMLTNAATEKQKKQARRGIKNC